MRMEDLTDKQLKEQIKKFSKKMREQEKLIFDYGMELRKRNLEAEDKDRRDIKEHLKLLPQGWVAMDDDGDWYYFTVKPKLGKNSWMASPCTCCMITPFKIKRVLDWRESLIECGL